MHENSRMQNAQSIRDVIRYIERFKNALIVIYLDDAIIDSTLFSSHIRDISLIHRAGLRVLIVPGARRRIDHVLASSGISWTQQNGVRITADEAMSQIKMAAFDVSNTVMTSLAAEHISAVIGNWVRARALGVQHGVDYGTAGKIDKLQADAILTVLQSGFIPIFPCIGWSVVGKPYNISSVALAEEIAVQLQADKLFFVIPNAELCASQFIIPEKIGVSETGKVPALNLDEVAAFIAANSATAVIKNSDTEHSVYGANDKNMSNSAHELSAASPQRNEKIMSLLHIASRACTAGVQRVHILNGSRDGVLPCELFSDMGSGTMIYAKNYGDIRAMQNEDVPAVLSLMRPFVASGKLLPRTDRQLRDTLADYIVYELDGGIRACAALHVYDAHQAEIAAVAVDETYAHMGVGAQLIETLIARAKKENCQSVFVLTTQTFDWFEKFGFAPADIATLPEKRILQWTHQRGSKAYRLTLHEA
ncbi:MAG: GNAT family N-acetyltransferase [Treponema sp.]|nr:GNAT family N-acetyltransferase [Treponema sp.]